MNFCHNCGNRIDENSKFCSSCGANLNTYFLSNGDNDISSAKIKDFKKATKTLNVISLCLVIPYTLLSCIIVLFADFYTVSDRLGYMIGLIWPTVFVVILFMFVKYIEKYNFNKKIAINVHLVISIIFIGALVLGGFAMILLSYGMVIFPFASSILQILISSKMKKSTMVV